MGWTNRNLVQVWDGDFAEPTDQELAQYAYCATPIGERPRPTCGKPGGGRATHTRHGEKACPLCVEAERLYAQHRRDLQPQTEKAVA